MATVHHSALGSIPPHVRGSKKVCREARLAALPLERCCPMGIQQGAQSYPCGKRLDTSWAGWGSWDGKKLFTLLDLCVSSLRRGHANLLCIVPILTDDPRRESSFARRCRRPDACATEAPCCHAGDKDVRHACLHLGLREHRDVCRHAVEALGMGYFFAIDYMHARPIILHLSSAFFNG